MNNNKTYFNLILIIHYRNNDFIRLFGLTVPS